MEDILGPWARRLNPINVSILPKVIYIFSEISTKIPMTFFFCFCFAEIETSILKCIWDLRGLDLGKILLKKNKVRQLTFLTSKFTTKLQ